MGPNVALKTFADFARATASQDAFGPKGVLSFMGNVPGFIEAFKNPSSPPDMSDFIALRETYLEIFNERVREAAAGCGHLSADAQFARPSSRQRLHS